MSEPAAGSSTKAERQSLPVRLKEWFGVITGVVSGIAWCLNRTQGAVWTKWFLAVCLAVIVLVIPWLVLRKLIRSRWRFPVYLVCVFVLSIFASLATTKRVTLQSCAVADARLAAALAGMKLQDAKTHDNEMTLRGNPVLARVRYPEEIHVIVSFDWIRRDVFERTYQARVYFVAPVYRDDQCHASIADVQLRDSSFQPMSSIGAYLVAWAESPYAISELDFDLGKVVKTNLERALDEP